MDSVLACIFTSFCSLPLRTLDASDCCTRVHSSIDWTIDGDLLQARASIVKNRFLFTRTVSLYDPKNSGAQDYRKLAVEFEMRLGQTKQRKKVHAEKKHDAR